MRPDTHLLAVRVPAMIMTAVACYTSAVAREGFERVGEGRGGRNLLLGRGKRRRVLAGGVEVDGGVVDLREWGERLISTNPELQR